MGLVCSIPIQVYAANPLESQEQLDRARQQQEAREARLGEERIGWNDVQRDGNMQRPMNRPSSISPSFYISHIRLAEEAAPIGPLKRFSDERPLVKMVEPVSTRLVKGPLASEATREAIVLDTPYEFTFLKKEMKPYVNRKLSIEEVNELSSKLNNSLISRGYVTSKITIPPQSLASGQLQFNLQLGRIESVGYAEGSPHLPWENAFPFREGDILNIRDIEQGLEQMRRPSSQSASVELEAGSMPLYSKVILQTTKKPLIHGMIAIDDSGLKDTGKMQWNALIGVDRVFNANDTFQLNINGDAAREGSVKGTRSHSLSYSIPRGKDTFSMYFSSTNYHQTVDTMATLFKSASEVKTFRASWQHTFHRSRTIKRTWDVSISKRNSKNFINDTEVEVQRGNTAAIEIGVSECRYMKQNTLYSRVSFKKV